MWCYTKGLRYGNSREKKEEKAKMREILFKAKRRNWKELPKGQWWVEGNLVFSNDAEEDYKAIIIPNIDSNMFIKDRQFFVDLGFENWCRVDKDTICQFTGSTDKNSKQIWENEVVEDKYLRYKVVWDNEEGSWMLETISTARYGLAGIGRVNNEKFEVIGNIFDNPELLGE